MARTYSVEEQLSVLSPEQLEELKQALIQQRDAELEKENGGESTRAILGKGLVRGVAAFGEGALLGFQRRPISEHSAFQKQPSTANEYEDFLRKEQIRNAVDPSRIQAQMELDEIERSKREQAGSLTPSLANNVGLESGQMNLPKSTSSDISKVNLSEIDESKIEELLGPRPPEFSTVRERNRSGGYDEKIIKSSAREEWDKKAQKLFDAGLKSQEKFIKDKAGAEGSVSGTRNFIRSFSESKQELIDAGFKNIGGSDLGGLVNRIGAGITEKTGKLPKTTKFINRLKVIANQQARDIEGGRVTDQDRQIYADAMANAIKFPNETNIGLAADTLFDLKTKGANIDSVIKEFDNSGIDIFKSISSEIKRLTTPISVHNQPIRTIGRFMVEEE